MTANHKGLNALYGLVILIIGLLILGFTKTAGWLLVVFGTFLFIGQFFGD